MYRFTVTIATPKVATISRGFTLPLAII